MRKWILTAVSLLCVTALLLNSQVVSAQGSAWPKTMTMQGTKLVLYQPQVDEWTNFTDIVIRMAFTLTPQGGKDAVGVMAVKAKTQNNVDTRTVVFTNMVITGTTFPSLSDSDAAQMDQLVRSFVTPGYTVTVPLDGVVACSKKPQMAATPKIKNDPPTIFVSNGLAILLEVDGKPVEAAIPNTSLSFVVNANWPVFVDNSGPPYYMFGGQQWLKAASLNGAWTPTSSLPAGLVNLAQDPQWANLKSAIPPPTPTTDPPSVIFSNGSADLIMFTGKPVFTAIPGTKLSYATNTDSDLFLYQPTKAYYYLTAGRWFQASGLQGPWSYATDSLPADFRKIPHSCPASRVYVSIPGTPEAEDAVLIAQIPTKVVVDPVSAAAQASVTYSGAPDFKPIEGTSMSYAANTADKVIKVGDLYYLCLQAVWFVSTSPDGPWTTAKTVPSEIYTIPPSSPVYNVTYVTQTTDDDGDVESSYTAGYLGAFVIGAAVGAVVASGSGYDYPPYYYYPAVGYPVYYPYAATYGARAVYNPYTGVRGVVHTAYTPYGGAAWGSAYNPYTGTYARGATAYGPYGSASAARAYNPYTGTYAQGGSVNTAYGSRSAASAYNPNTGAAAATRQGSSPNAQWGSSVATKGNQSIATQHVTTDRGTVRSVETGAGGSAVGVSGARGNAGVVQTTGGDTYAGKDGNVYKKTDDGWQKYDNGGQNSAQRPTQDQANQLNQDAQNRQRGNAQAQNYQGSFAGQPAAQNAQRGGGAFQGVNNGRAANNFSSRGQSSRATMQGGGVFGGGGRSGGSFGGGGRPGGGGGGRRR